MVRCNPRHLMRLCSPIRLCNPVRSCGRFIQRVVILLLATFVALNLIYMFPLTGETRGFLTRSAAELNPAQEVRIPRSAIGEQAIQEKTTLAPKPVEQAPEVKATLSPKPAEQLPQAKTTLLPKPVAHRKRKDRCTLYKWSSEVTRKTEINVLRARILPSEVDDVTMVTQLDASRLPRLVDMAKLWKWPMSVSVYVREEVLDKYRQVLTKTFVNRTNIAIHLVVNSKTYYPVNILRNIALENANTTYVFLNDVDFIPMPNIEEKLRMHLEREKENLAKDQLFVVAAFEHLQSGMKIPETKEELIHMWMQNRTVRPVHFSTVKGKFVPNHGQGATNYDLWKSTLKPYKINFHIYYEPYIIIKKSKVVKYDNSFVGRYFDKSSQVMELHAQGFRFVGLPDVYTVHVWHTNSPFYRTIYDCAFTNHERFKAYLRKRYRIKV